MITILHDGRAGQNIHVAECPYCSAAIRFHLATPISCLECRQPIPPFYLLVEKDPVVSKRTRLEYYDLGQAWLDGDF